MKIITNKLLSIKFRLSNDTNHLKTVKKNISINEQNIEITTFDKPSTNRRIVNYTFKKIGDYFPKTTQTMCRHQKVASKSQNSSIIKGQMNNKIMTYLPDKIIYGPLLRHKETATELIEILKKRRSDHDFESHSKEVDALNEIQITLDSGEAVSESVVVGLLTSIFGSLDNFLASLKLSEQEFEFVFF